MEAAADAGAGDDSSLPTVDLGGVIAVVPTFSFPPLAERLLERGDFDAVVVKAYAAEAGGMGTFAVEDIAPLVGEEAFNPPAIPRELPPPAVADALEMAAAVALAAASSFPGLVSNRDRNVETLGSTAKLGRANGTVRRFVGFDMSGNNGVCCGGCQSSIKVGSREKSALRTQHSTPTLHDTPISRE